jgi:hypothetical protein
LPSAATGEALNPFPTFLETLPVNLGAGLQIVGVEAPLFART